MKVIYMECTILLAQSRGVVLKGNGSIAFTESGLKYFILSEEN
jgi:hypothetical protein